MCGRTRCTLAADDFPRACGFNNTRSVHMDRYRPRYNVAPGSYMPVVRRDTGDGGGAAATDAVVHCMKWGLVPSFTKPNDKPDHYRMFNARSESVSEKPSFRRLMPKNRCVVVMDGFYEWKKDGSKKQPYYVHFNNGKPLIFAALYDSWKNPEGETLYTFTIVTTSCSSALEWLHDRMPVILGDKISIDVWLYDPSSSKSSTILKPYENSDLVWYPVTPAIGKPSFEGPECIIEIPLKNEKNLISKFFAKKRVDNEQESSPKVEISTKEYVKEDPYKSLKEEEEASDLPTVSGDDNKNYKSGISPLKHTESEMCGRKREYEELASDPSDDNNGKLSISKKKSNLTNTGQKQPTLLSYFGRS